MIDPIKHSKLYPFRDNPKVLLLLLLLYYDGAGEDFTERALLPFILVLKQIPSGGLDTFTC
jgi:hypothetical protein